MKTKVLEAKVEEKSGLIAKRSFTIVQNDVHIVIKKGDNLNDIPKRFLENLKTEGII